MKERNKHYNQELDCYFSEQFKNSLSFDEEKKYIEQLINGDKDARNKLIEHNLRLVAFVVKKIIGTGYDYHELINIGTIGLIKGIDTYKTDKNVKLATYASKCITNEILMFIRKEKKHNTYLITNNDCLYFDGSVEKRLENIIENTISSECNIEEEYINSEFKNILINVIYMLNEHERKSLIYYIYFELSQQEIANKLGISQAQVSRMLKKVFNKIKPYFDDKKLSYGEFEELKLAKKKRLNKSFEI